MDIFLFAIITLEVVRTKCNSSKTNFNLDTQGKKLTSKATEFDEMFKGEDDGLPF